MEHSIAFVGAQRRTRHPARGGHQGPWFDGGPRRRRLLETIIAALRPRRLFDPAGALPRHLQADLGLMAASDPHWTDIDTGVRTRETPC